MALVVPDTGERKLLTYMVGVSPGGNLKLKLFTNNITPDENTVDGTPTEAVAAGYASIALASGTWTVATVSNVTTLEYPAQTFTMTAAMNAYGYYITNAANELLWIERFTGAPFSIPSGGGTIEISLKITLD